MNRPVYQVEMSTDGRHKVTVTIEDPGGTDAALAWARGTYAKLIRASDSIAESQAVESPETEPPLCGVHRLPMARMNGKRGPFWSCHAKNQDGSWCSFKANGDATTYQ